MPGYFAEGTDPVLPHEHGRSDPSLPFGKSVSLSGAVQYMIMHSDGISESGSSGRIVCGALCTELQKGVQPFP